MKKIIYILSAIVISTTFLGCDDNDIAPIGDESAKPSVTVTSETTSINEDGSPTFSISINLDKPIKTTTTFSATQIGGDASSGEFSVASAVIPAYQTSTTMEITVNEDVEIEGSELVELQIAPSSIPDLYEVLGSPTFSFNIENYTSDEALLSIEWSNSEDDHLCDIDFDVFLDSFEAYAFTGNCPESVYKCINNSQCTGVLSDGTHLIIVDLWDLHGADPDIAIPLKLTVGKAGKFLSTPINLGSFYTTNSPDSASGANGDEGQMIVGSIEVTNGKYTIFDSSGNLVSQE